MTIGDKLRNIRTEKGFSQNDIAKKLGISQPSYAQYESGKRKPKIETLFRISNALGMTPEEFRDWWFSDEVESDFYKGMSAKEMRSISAMRTLQEVRHQKSDLESAGRLLPIIDFDSHFEILLHDYEKLNTIGRNEAVKRVSELTEIKKYTEKEDK